MKDEMYPKPPLPPGGDPFDNYDDVEMEVEGVDDDDADDSEEESRRAPPIVASPPPPRPEMPELQPVAEPVIVRAMCYPVIYSMVLLLIY